MKVSGKLRGVALGFDVTSPHLQPVIYATSPPRIQTNPETGLPQLNHDFVDQLTRTKFYDWHYEDEMRVYVKLDHETRESGMYFYPFDASIVLREIVLGPRCELPTMSIAELVRPHDSEIRITKSTLANSSFSVVEATDANSIDNM